MTTNTSKTSRFGRGGAQAIEEEEAIRAMRGGGSFRKTHYLPKIGKGNHIYLRYLTDSPDWFYVQQHAGVKTKAAPSDWPQDRKFPESMPAICRYDKAFQADPEHGLEAVYADCAICDLEIESNYGRKATASTRVYALAILREEVLGTEEMVAAGQITPEMVGKRVGFKDATREVEVPKKDDKGETIKDAEGKAVLEKVVEPAIIVVNQAVGNYFAGLQSMYGMYGTVLDRDYAVQQHNEMKDVDYNHIPMDPIASLKPGTEGWGRYEKAIEEQGESVDIEALLMDRSSDEYYALFFDPRVSAPKRENEGGNNTPQGGGQAQAPTAQQQTAPNGDVDQDKLAAMRARVRGDAAPAPAQEPEKTSAGAATPAGGIDFS